MPSVPRTTIASLSLESEVRLRRRGGGSLRRPSRPEANRGFENERPRRAERLSRNLGVGERASVRGLGGTPFRFGFFPPPGRDPFYGRPQSPYGLSNKTTGRGEGQGRERLSSILLSFCEALTVRVLDVDGREVHSAIKGDSKLEGPAS
jgi:hypothetical protein